MKILFVYLFTGFVRSVSQAFAKDCPSSEKALKYKST